MNKLPRWTADAGLLLLRLCVGSMMLVGHGIPKVLEFSDKMAHFPDPLGVGSTASLSLAIFGEVICSALLIVGLVTRGATVPFAITMLVAALVVHAGDPWSQKELALLYAVAALGLIGTGAGRFSLDRVLWTRKPGEGEA